MGKNTSAADDIIFDDLGDPKLSRLQRLALAATKNVKIEFTQDTVFDAARKATGLTDFGPRPITEPLQVLLDAYKSDPDMSGAGKNQVFGDLVRCASNHLIIHDRIKNTQHLTETQITKPLSVSGMPRSGTTHLVNLLAADSRFRSLPL